MSPRLQTLQDPLAQNKSDWPFRQEGRLPFLDVEATLQIWDQLFSPALPYCRVRGKDGSGDELVTAKKSLISGWTARRIVTGRGSVGGIHVPGD